MDYRAKCEGFKKKKKKKNGKRAERQSTTNMFEISESWSNWLDVNVSLLITHK